MTFGAVTAPGAGFLAGGEVTPGTWRPGRRPADGPALRPRLAAASESGRAVPGRGAPGGRCGPRPDFRHHHRQARRIVQAFGHPLDVIQGHGLDQAVAPGDIADIQALALEGAKLGRDPGIGGKGQRERPGQIGLGVVQFRLRRAIGGEFAIVSCTTGMVWRTASARVATDPSITLARL